MYEMERRKGMILFGGLILVVVGLSLAAYLISGHMGIEERFNSAVGDYVQVRRKKALQAYSDLILRAIHYII